EPALADAAPMPAMNFRQNEMLRDPEYRDVARRHALLTISRTMPGLRDAVGLSDEQQARLLELLADQQVQMSALSPLEPQPGQSMEDLRRTAAQQLQARDEQAQSEIRELLGDQAYQRWQDYRSTL